MVAPKGAIWNRNLLQWKLFSDAENQPIMIIYIETNEIQGKTTVTNELS